MARAPAPAHQRARGALDVSWHRRGATTALAGLRQSGCLRARFPRPEPGIWAGAVTVNISGGVVGGDVLEQAFSVETGASASVAAQAAERFYRALPGTTASRIRNSVRVGAGAALEWLPQETILFDGAAADRVLDVTLAPDAWFLGVESLVFGRAAMGEDVRALRLRDTIHVHRAGRLLLHDALRIDGEARAILAGRATGGGARAIATIVHVSPGAEARAGALRAALSGLADGGVSAWDGLLIARLAAPDGALLRAAVVSGLAPLRDGRPLPRVWQC